MWKIPHIREQLSPCAKTIEPVLQSLKTATTEAYTPQLESSPYLLQLAKSPHSMKTQHSLNKYISKKFIYIRTSHFCVLLLSSRRVKSDQQVVCAFEVVVVIGRLSLCR